MILLTLILFVTIAYAGLIVAFTIGLRRVLLQKGGGDNPILPISVIVAFKDEALNLPILLEAMINQSLPKEKFELILVNDHSSDDSALIVKHYCSMCSHFRLVNLSDNLRGKKAAIAIGIESSTNSLIALTDADCIPSERWLETISLEMNKGIVLMIGPVVMFPVDNLIQKIQALEYSSLMASASGSCGIGHPVIASSANIVFRNDQLKVSEFTFNPKVSSGDDMFLIHHVKRLSGCSISFLGNRDAIIKTSSKSTIEEALIQRKRWASKSIHYRDRDTIIAGLIVLLFNLILILLLFLTIFKIVYLYYFFLLFLVKSFADFILLHRYLSFTEQKELLMVFLPLQLVYPFYIVYSFFAGIFTKILWKGRSIN